MTRSGRQGEQRALAAELRDRGVPLAEIATTLRGRYGVNARLAVRLARGWTQAEVAAAWTRRWPDDPKTFKSVSYWENWPSPTGHAPSLAVLDRLARLYGCDVADLLAGWGEHGPRAAPPPGVEGEALAWQVEHLDLPQLTRSVVDWARCLPEHQRRPLLLKLSTAAAMAGGRAGGAPTAALRRGPGPAELCGSWTSHYTYFSTGRDRECTGRHVLALRERAGRLVGRSEPTGTGFLDLDLHVDGHLVVGSWSEHTAPTGYYRGAVHHGTVMMVLDPTGRSMRGRWLGPDRDFAVDSGIWTLIRGADPPVTPPAS